LAHFAAQQIVRFAPLFPGGKLSGPLKDAAYLLAFFAHCYR
jgi:hypothetical protein